VRGARPARALARPACLAELPDAEPITALRDFAFFRLEITGGRLVSGLGGAVKRSALTRPSLVAVSVPS
jgi:hypothetical protein